MSDHWSTEPSALVQYKTNILHNVPLPLDVVKVTVPKVRVVDARVPLPTDEVTIVVEAFQTFIAWPRHLVRIIPKPPIII